MLRIKNVLVIEFLNFIRELLTSMELTTVSVAIMRTVLPIRESGFGKMRRNANRVLWKCVTVDLYFKVVSGLVITEVINKNQCCQLCRKCEKSSELTVENFLLI